MKVHFCENGRLPSSGALYLLAHKCFTAGPRIAETCGKIAKKKHFSSFFYSPMCPSTIISTELDFLIAKDTSLYIWKICGFNNGLLWAVMGLFLMNAGCSLFGEKKEMEKAPQRRRGNGEYDPISESCACLNILHLRRRPGKYLCSTAIADFRFFHQ